MEDELQFFLMGDDLQYYFVNERRPQILLKMEDHIRLGVRYCEGTMDIFIIFESKHFFLFYHSNGFSYT